MLTELAVVGVLSAIATSVVVGRHLGQARERSKVRRAIREAPALSSTQTDGSVVCVTGLVLAPGADLIAPLSGARCVLYRSAAVSSVWTGNGNRYEHFAMCTFPVDGGSAGNVLVVGEHAVLDAPSRLTPPDEHRRLRFLAVLGLTGVRDLAGRPMSNGRHRLEEWLVRPGDRVSVVGLLMRAATDGPTAGEVGYRDAHLETRIVGNQAHPLLVQVHGK